MKIYLLFYLMFIYSAHACTASSESIFYIGDGAPAPSYEFPYCYNLDVKVDMSKSITTENFQGSTESSQTFTNESPEPEQCVIAPTVEGDPSIDINALMNFPLELPDSSPDDPFFFGDVTDESSSVEEMPHCALTIGKALPSAQSEENISVERTIRDVHCVIAVQPNHEARIVVTLPPKKSFGSSIYGYFRSLLFNKKAP